MPQIFDRFDLDDAEAQCIVDGYLAGDPQITIDNLQNDVTNSNPGGEVNGTAIGCVDDDDLVGGLAAQGLDVTPDEARCFFAAGLSGESDAEIFEAYATCGVAGRLYAESLDDVVLSDDSVACLDRVLPDFTFFDADDALAECLTADELAAVGAG